MIVDAPIIDDQNVAQLEQHLVKSGIQISSHGAQYFIMVEENPIVKSPRLASKEAKTIGE